MKLPVIQNAFENVKKFSQEKLEKNIQMECQKLSRNVIYKSLPGERGYLYYWRNFGTAGTFD